MVVLCQQCGGGLPAGARFCPTCGNPVLPLPAPGASGETAFDAAGRKQVTVLSADFQGFTAFAANRDAEEVHEFITNCWRHLSPLIHSHGGTVEKYIGDAILAVFGAEHAREQDPAQAIRCALAMQACLRRLQSVGQPPPLPMRIGIHTGFAVVQAGAGGSGNIATGDTVNTADRLQKLAPPGGVLISSATYRHIEGLFDVGPPAHLFIEGKAQPVIGHVVLRSRPRAVARLVRGLAGTETRMVGREEELARLKTAFEQVLEKRNPRVVTIIGEAGLGKTRLVQEFLKCIEMSPDMVRLFSCRATEESSGSPFGLLRDLLATRFDIQDTDPTAVAREKLEAGVIGLLSEEKSYSGDSQSVAMAHFMGNLAGFDFSDSRHLQAWGSDPLQFQRRALDAAGRFFALTSDGAGGGAAAAAAGRRAAMMVVEDFHWSDDGSLELIEYLAASCDAPLLIVCLTRPEFLERHRDWGGCFPAHTSVRLRPLTEMDSASLAAQILNEPASPPMELARRISITAEGNPFYIEEIIKMLVDRRRIDSDHAPWRIEAGLPGGMLPSTLTGILQARLDALSPVERLVAQRASVLGRVFWDTALAWLEARIRERPGTTPDASARGHSCELTAALDSLSRKGVIHRLETSNRAGATEYSFNHELLRGVAYEGLLKKSRQHLHALAASWLIEDGGGRAGESASQVAGHWEKAGRLTEAAQWYGRAGQQAWASYLPAMAVDSLQKALSLTPAAEGPAPPGGSRLQWLHGLVESLGAQAKFDEARNVCGQMQKEAVAAHDVLAEARTWNALAFLHERQGRNRESVQAAERAVEVSAQAGPEGRREQSRALYLKGWAQYRLANAGEVLALAGKSFALARQLGDQTAMALSCKLYGVAHLQLCHYPEADQYFQEGLAMARAIGDLRTVAAMLSNRGEVARARSDYANAAGLYAEAVAISREIGARESEMIYLANLHAAHLGMGRCAEAEAGLRELLIPAANVRMLNLAEVCVLLSEACLLQGKIDEAAALASQAQAAAEAAHDLLINADAWRMLGMAAAAGPLLPATVSAAHRCFQQSLDLGRQIQSSAGQARTLVAWANLEIRGRNIPPARRKLETARAAYVGIGIEIEAQKIDELLSRLGSGTPTPPQTT